MFRIERKVALQYAVDMPAALQFAAEVTAHLEEHYPPAAHMKFGVELFGSNVLCFHSDVKSLDSWMEMNPQLLKDRDYGEILDRHKRLWVPGSLRERVIGLAG